MNQSKLLAQVGYPMPTPPTNAGTPFNAAQPVSTLETVINVAIGILTLIAVIYFTLQIIFAGYAMFSSQGDEKKLEAARSRLTNGILGLTIVVVSLGLAALLAKLLGLGDVFNLTAIFNTLSF
jgi:hypothetical protein